jgi:hypothetical protein
VFFLHFQGHYLGAIDGKKIADATRGILRTLMTNSVARHANLTGRGRRTGICELKIMDVVISMEIRFCILYVI